MSNERDKQRKQLVNYIQSATAEAIGEGQPILDQDTASTIINLMRILQIDMFNSPFEIPQDGRAKKGEVRIAITPGDNPILRVTTEGGIRNNDGTTERWPPEDNIRDEG
jgi:hypothetical protein